MAAQDTSREASLDHLKVALVALVTAHHLAITYGGSGSWYYRDPAAAPSLALGLFNATNQSYFMGLFFFISGLFTPGALRRKGSRQFLVDRLRRFGIPVLVFGLAIAPWLEYVKRISLGRNTPPLPRYWLERIADVENFDPGPLWFLCALFLFNLAFVAFRRLRGTSPQQRVVTATVPGLLGLTAALALTTALTRIPFPIGSEVWHFQLAYFPQYVVLFAAGTWAADSGTNVLLSDRWFAPAALVATLCVPASLLLYVLGAHRDRALLHGGLRWQAFAWAGLEDVECVAFSVACILAASRWLNRPSRLGSALSENAFGAYVVHAPVIVAWALLVQHTPLPTSLRFAFGILTGVAISFGLSGLLRQLAPVRRVL